MVRIGKDIMTSTTFGKSTLQKLQIAAEEYSEYLKKFQTGEAGFVFNQVTYSSLQSDLNEAAMEYYEDYNRNFKF